MQAIQFIVTVLGFYIISRQIKGYKNMLDDFQRQINKLSHYVFGHQTGK